MARMKYIQHNFTSGEISKMAEGRVDFAKYYHSVKTMRNFLPTVLGGATRRPGLHFADYPKYWNSKYGLYPGNKKCRLIPFKYGVTQAYVIEAGDQYFRFWMDGYLIRTLIGSDLVTNGTFAADLAGWTDYSIFPGYAAWDAGEAALVSYGTAISDNIQINVNAGAGTFTRLTGSFLDDGFIPDQTITTWGFSNDGNNTTKVIAGVTDLIITVTNNAGLVDEIGDGNERISADLTIGSIGQSIATDQWKTYLLTFDVSFNPVKVRIGTGAGWTDIVYDVPFSPGSKQIAFIARDAATFIQFIAVEGAPFGYSLIDNVVCKEYAPVEIASPYPEVDLPLLKWAQDANDLYIVHPLYAPRILTRSSSTIWTLETMEFDDGPYFNEVEHPTITPDWAGPTVNKVTNGDFHVDASWNKGANWTIAGGVASKSAGAANNLWQDTAEVLNEVYKVTYTIKSISGGNLRANIGGVNGTWRTEAGTYSQIIVATGGGDLTFEPSHANVVCSIDDVWVGRLSILTAEYGLFDAGHVWACWRIDQATVWGWCRIEQVNSSTNAYAYVGTSIGNNASEHHREGRWSDYRGWPRSVTFHENRLAFGGSTTSPQTFWASKTEEFNNMSPGTTDSDAVQFTLGSNDVNLIQWILSARNLLPGTAGGEFRVSGGNDNPITPTSVDAKSDTTYGCADIQPLRVAGAVIFVQNAGRQLLELLYNYDSDSYKAKDLTQLADHLTENGLMEIVYQKGYLPVIWAYDREGIFLALTYQREQEVIGWSHHVSGIAESLAVIPNPTEMMDEVYAIVLRTLNGEEVRCMEYFDPYLNVDCGLCGSFSSPVSVISGFEHLAGVTINIVGDNAVYPPQVVNSNGQITLSPAVSSVEGGIGYTSYLETLRPEIQSEQETIQASKKRWTRIYVRLVDTMGLKINGEEIPFRSSLDPMGEGITPFDGDKEMMNLGWEDEGRIIIEQDKPLPATILCIFGNLEVNED